MGHPARYRRNMRRLSRRRPGLTNQTAVVITTPAGLTQTIRLTRITLTCRSTPRTRLHRTKIRQLTGSGTRIVHPRAFTLRINGRHQYLVIQ